MENPQCPSKPVRLRSGGPVALRLEPGLDIGEVLTVLKVDRKVAERFAGSEVVQLRDRTKVRAE